MKHDDANAGPGSPGSMPRDVGGAGAGAGDESGDGERTGLAALFARFLRFGCLAWGGPTAQIEMLRRELVEEEGWIDAARFKRVLAVYQALPGPEAFELCCYFGHLKRGRLGATAAGLGFLLPGLVLMLVASWLYVRHGSGSDVVASAMAGAGMVVAALIANAALNLWKHVVTAPWLVWCAVVSMLGFGAGAPFWIGVAGCALAGAVRSRGRAACAAVLAVTLACSLGFALHAARERAAHEEQAKLRAHISERPPAFGSHPVGPLALTGLKAGLLTFGGAYTAIPVVQADVGQAPDGSGWLDQRRLQDTLAIGAVLPAPLVIFCTMVGYLGAGFPGAMVMTVCVFLPALGFTLIGHRYLERLVYDTRWHGLLDGVAASVVGVLAVTAAGTLTSAMLSGPHAVVCLVAWAILASFRRRWIVPALVLGGVLWGLTPIGLGWVYAAMGWGG